MALSPPGVPLIAGAGPVGLAAALLLARHGVATRLIDAAARPAPHSRALAVNPRTLALLEPTGVTARMLELGLPIRGARFWRRGKVLAELSFERLAHRFPFMLALSQATTERLLEEALAAAGGSVERGVRLVTCRDGADAVETHLRHESDGREEPVSCPWLLAADGARSTVRRELGVGFEGNAFDNDWHLSDLPLHTDHAPDRAHVHFLDGGGFVFLIRVINGSDAAAADTAAAAAAPLWRVMGNVADPVAALTGAEPAGPPVWVSQFRVSHRIAARLRVGRVYFAGDAAHVHSPVGARGMNLGIEDAWVLSRLVQRVQMHRYEEHRRDVDRRVVRRVELISRVARGESAAARVVRSAVLPRVMRIPALQDRFIAAVTGLDHGVEDGK